MKFKNLNSKQGWIIAALAIVLTVGGYFVINETQIVAQMTNRETTQSTENGAESMTVTIQPASAVMSEVSAAGHVELVSEEYVMQDVSAEVAEIVVNVGDQVQAGDLLITLDTTELERAVLLAELEVEAARNALARLTEEADAAEIAVAKANLVEAEENLADVLAGPSAEEIAAAQSSLSSAWANYNEVQAGPSDAELTQLSADLMKAEVALAEAQRAYDEVAWRNDVGMTSQAADLQDATIDYEKALAAYEESMAPADTSTIQSALSSAQDAQVKLDELLNSPTAAEIATAEANVADAEAALNDLLTGPTETDLRDAEINLEKVLIDLQVAYADLDAAKIFAPSDGTVLEINTEVGQRVTQEGTAVVTLADTTQLELTIDVAEVDIVQISIGQAATIELDALPDQTFAGVVEYIAPTSDDSSGIVSYGVTIRLTDESLDRVLPGMTAVSTIVETNATTSDSWLVPTSAIRQQGDATVVMVVAEEGSIPVEVLPGSVQGEWTVVQSTELSVGNEVMGSVTSYISEDEGFGPPGEGAGDRPPGGGMGRALR
ncbi:efflux RND transporter periplasmic adaptor subunit [Chloroflexi bacterium TSY]|nr:efflux RND transporter periplasmic adaptor subunit [Chloroflexi bacterium TSY]